MSTVNRVFILGYLGTDPEDMTSREGKHYTKLNLATNRFWRTKEGQLERKTDWHRVSVFGKKGMLCRERLRKGSPICVEGYLSTYEFEEGGKRRYTTSITADEVTFLPHPRPTRTEAVTPGMAEDASLGTGAGAGVGQPRPAIDH